MKAASWKFVFSGKCDVARVKASPLFELARVLSNLVSRRRGVGE